MGKRLILMIFAVLLVSCCLYGCTEKETDATSKEQAEEKDALPSEATVSASEESAETVSQGSGNVGTMTVISYRVTDRVYNDGRVSLRYPQITGLRNLELQTICNDWIENIVMQDLGQEADTAYEVRYEVMTSTPEMLSLLIKGYRNTEESPYPQILRYTLNVDVEGGRILTLADFFDPQQLAGKIVAGEGGTVTGDVDKAAAAEYLSALSADTLAEEFRSYDFSEGRSTPGGFSYMKSGTLHVLIPALHALGDYLDIAVE